MKNKTCETCIHGAISVGGGDEVNLCLYRFDTVEVEEDHTKLIKPIPTEKTCSKWNDDISNRPDWW